MRSPPTPSSQDLLRQLSTCTASITHLLDAQPVFATVIAAELRQALATLVPETPPNPDAVYLNEYVYDTPTTPAGDSAVRSAHLTRTRNLTQVLQEAIATHTTATQRAKEPQTGSVSQAVGFYPNAYSTGRDGDNAALHVEAFNTLIDALKNDSLALYQRKLEVFWSSPHLSTGALSVHAAMNQKQRQLFCLEADLQLAETRRHLTDAQQALEKQPANTQAQTAVATAKARLQVLIEGRQLIENQVLHETSGNPMPVLAAGISLYARGQPEWSVALSGCFVLAEQLHTLRPVVLYTPQLGIEMFEHFYAMANTLSRRLVAGADKALLLANIPTGERARADSALSSGQNLRYTPITGQLFTTCLQTQRDQQEIDIDQALDTPTATFEALAAKLATALALPLKGCPSLMARLPKPTEPMPGSAVAHTPPDSEQQTQLIQLWNSLNQQIDYVLNHDKHPTLDSVLTPLLKETFAQLPATTGLASLYVNRYRTDSTGQRHFESSRTLREALGSLLLWENSALETDEDEDQAAQKDSVGTVAESIFSSPTAFSETAQIAQGSLLPGLAEALQAGLAAQVTRYWQTPIAPELVCPQIKLAQIYRQALDVQARLRHADNTLSPHAKLLIDRALKYPTQARREAGFNHGARPGVYQLTVNTGSAEGARLAGSFVLTPSDGSSGVHPHWSHGHKNLSTQGLGGNITEGPVVVFTPDQGFEEFATLHTLHDTLQARINAGEEAGRLFVSGLPLSVQSTKTGLWGSDLHDTFAPIEADFVADSIQALLDKQQSDIQALLGLTEGEADTQSNGRAELVELLDMAGAFMARNLLLLEHWRPDWEKRLHPTDQKALQDQAQSTRQKQDDLGEQWKVLIPTLAEYAKEQVLLKIRAFLAEKGPHDKARATYPAQGVDPDQTMVIRTTRTRIGTGAGFGSLHERVVSSQMSLTNLLLKNNKPWDRSLSWTEDDLLEATLITAQGEWVPDAQGQAISVGKEHLEQWVKALNVGHQYTQNVLKKHLDPDATTADAQALQKAWTTSQASALSYAALSARLSPDAYTTVLASDNTQKKAAAWVAAVLACADPKARQPVDGQAVIANALMFNPASDAPEGRGGQTVNGVLVLSTAADAMRVLYTPHAPDGLELREIASLDALAKLMRSRAWQAYLQARLPANTRLLNHRLAAYPGDVLAGLYRQNYLYLLDKTDTESVTNEELSYQATFNKVMFGVEVVTTVLGGFPWSGQLTSSAFGWAARMARTTRSLGQKIAGLIMRRGVAGRVLFEVATATTTVAGAARAAGIGLQPLQMLLRPATRKPLPGLTGYQSAFQLESPRLVMIGGIPSGSSLAEGTGIYRTPGSAKNLLVRSTSETGKEQVFRIQDSFNLYDRNGLVAPVLTPSGGWTQFRLRKMPNQLWSLDTLQRLPGGAPKAEGNSIKALREWEAHVSANAQSPNPLPTLDPSGFFSERNIPLKTWNKFVRLNGQVNALGQARLDPQGHAPFSDNLFVTWLGMNDQTRDAAQAFQQTHRINPLIWAVYISKSGELNKQGLARVIRLNRSPFGLRTPITDQHFKDWYQLSLRPAYQNRDAVTKFALYNGIHTDSWLKYVTSKGAFKMNIPTVAKRVNRLGLIQNVPLAGPSLPPA
ncbi:hypothetical protein F0170_22175 [Pseudomonas sp. MAFF 730085]|uniref:Uncharacterized protein n=1 Tax=Pseudomonas kitaguniensis TaxID=2607908 RepID=A0A5N7JYG2_9PSED|nr:hypothetical protein [Pseudomonas kitaguniensis]MPQ86448.1 hypothetical protein [Pseudomonas kitaguniensis]